MSTVKITELSQITVSTNTANTLLLGVDLPGDITGKLTVQSLSEGIYRNNPLNVGVSPITLPNTIGQFVSSSNNYIQVNLQNTDEEGTADYVVTANAGGDTYYYIDMGYTNINYNPLNANNSLGTSAYPLDGYLYVQGDGPGTLGGNLIIGTTTPDREVVLISGGINFENVAARITSTGLDLNFGKVLTFADDTVQSTAASPVAYSQASFALANTANAYAYNANTFLQANTGAALAASKVYTDTANTSLRLYSESSFLKKTSDTLTGNLVVTDGLTSKDSLVTGNTIIRGTLSVNNSTLLSNVSMLTLTASDDGAVVIPSNTFYMMHITGKSNNATRVVLDSFGANTYPLISGRMGRGSASAPAATQNNDVMMRIVGNGYLPVSGFRPSSPAKIDFVATQNYTEANTGSRIEFWNTPNNSNTIQKIASFDADSIEFSGVVNPVKGFIYTPTIFVGAQTAFTINFSTTSMIKASLDQNLTISLSNYVYGKVVEVWLTNTSGSTRTVTHGCTALNSSVNSTTFTMASTSSAYLRYFSIDGDNANTFVSIQSA
jgi:hypothetical protein